MTFLLSGVFQKIGQNGRPGRREPPRSISFDETSRMVSVWCRRRKVSFCVFYIVVLPDPWGRRVSSLGFLECFFKKLVYSAVLDDGKPPEH